MGVYVNGERGLVAIEPEVVNWRTGGVLKSVATMGLDHGHVNGSVSRPRSTTVLTGANEFFIKCVEGNSATEYQLLRLWGKGNRREFRAVTGGVFHSTGGADENEVYFKPQKIASRTYKVELGNLAPGEYGFLAPGIGNSGDIASRGKIYTFEIAE